MYLCDSALLRVQAIRQMTIDSAGTHHIVSKINLFRFDLSQGNRLSQDYKHRQHMEIDPSLQLCLCCIYAYALESIATVHVI